MANSRSSNSRLLAVGLVVLVVGVLLVLLIIRNQDDPPAEPAPVATGQPTSGSGQDSTGDEPLTPQQISTARLPLPLEVPEGLEAIAVRANFMRSVAAVPAPGDLVNLYRLPQPSPAEGEQQEEPTPGTVLPPAGADAQQVVEAAEVLAVTGPLPAANDGTLTLVVAVDPSEIAGIMPIANDAEVWFTLLPSPDDEATDEATEGDQ